LQHKEFPWGRLIFFATGNTHKFNEARQILAVYNIAVAMLRIKALEIQDDDMKNIAKASALDAANRSRLPVIVEDAGLFIGALQGFPGPYANYVYRTIGNEGVLKILENHRDRRAHFRSVVAFCTPNMSPICFHGVVEGRIAEETQGSSGFGFDPIFEPAENPRKTFGEMTMEEKNSISHRGRALRKFAEWYRSATLGVQQSF